MKYTFTLKGTLGHVRDGGAVAELIDDEVVTAEEVVMGEVEITGEEPDDDDSVQDDEEEHEQ